jgi:hypothetical protein
MNETDQALARREVALDTYSPVELRARLAEMRAEQEILQQFFQGVMVRDHDYGIIPGTREPTLLKPGAEKLAEYYGYAPTVKAVQEDCDRETGFYRARVTVALVSKRTGAVVAEGVGEANTMEGRYRWREAKRTCPACGASGTVIKSKEEYRDGGGWLCWRKLGGCGASYGPEDTRITAQPVGRVENDDPWALWNTVLKMAKKRALIDAVLSATRSSGLFTQDMEDLVGWVEGEVVSVSEAPRPRPAPPPPRASAPPRPSAPPPPPPEGPVDERDWPQGRPALEKAVQEAFAALPASEKGVFCGLMPGSVISGGVLKLGAVEMAAMEQALAYARSL